MDREFRVEGSRPTLFMSVFGSRGFMNVLGPADEIQRGEGL